MTGLPTKARGLSLAVALLCVAAARPAAFAKDEPIDPRATQIIARMDAYLKHLKTFSVTIEVGYDVEQAWGQKIEFGETRQLTVRRPSQLRLDVTDRDGSTSGVVFDGKSLTVFDKTDHAWASVPKTGSVEDAVAYFVDDLALRLPMASVFSGDLAGKIDGWASHVWLVGKETIEGVPCDHLALRGPWEDLQLWIEQGDEPLLRRMIITYTEAEGEPQFWAQLRDWNIAADPNDATFAFHPADDMVKISFAALTHKGLHDAVRPADEQKEVAP